MKEKVQYWMEMAQYDMQTAKVMLEGKRYLYVGFMCHQVVEKALKAYFTLITTDTPPFTHNLSLLAKQCNLLDKMTENQNHLLDLLQPLNIEARYPTYKEKLLKAVYTQRLCEHAPPIHNLLRLAKAAGIEPDKDQTEALIAITAFNIESRYPDVKRSFRAKCTPEFTARQMDTTRTFTYGRDR